MQRHTSRPKTVEHRLSISLSRIFLLIRFVITENIHTEAQDLFPTVPGTCMLGLVRDIFDFDHKPLMLSVRHLFTSIGNILMPENYKNGPKMSFVSDTLLTEKSGHTQQTGRTSYGTWLDNSEEALYDFYHKALGETLLEIPANQFVPFTYQSLLNGLKQLKGSDADFASPQQKQMVEFAANSLIRHSFINMPCGQGKSMSWMVPIMASLLTGRHIGMRIVVLPYKFLLGHMVHQAKSAFGVLSDRLRVEFAGSSDIDRETIPLYLQGRDLPALLLLNLDAAANLLEYHMELLQKWSLSNHLKRIYVDEFQQFIVEYRFRRVYHNLRHLGRIGIPVMCLSGSLLSEVAKSMMSYCGLISGEFMDSIDTVTAMDPVGDGFSFFVETVGDVPRAVVDFLENTKCTPCHILCASKRDAEKIRENLSKNLRILYVTGDTPSNEQGQCAKDWSLGNCDVLLSTIVALVGNDNSACKTILIAGFLFNVSSIIQAIGRLRPVQRGKNSIVKVFRQPIRSHHRRKAKETENTTFLELQEAGCLEANDFNHFSKIYSACGLLNFLSKTEGCFLQELSSLFGFGRTRCGRCSLCEISVSQANKKSSETTDKEIPVQPCKRKITNPYKKDDKHKCTQVAQRSQVHHENRTSHHDNSTCPKKLKTDFYDSQISISKISADKRSSQEKNIRRMAESVIAELLYRCIACGKATCNGECTVGCYRCGSRYHQTNLCSYNIGKLRIILCNKNVCFGCFDTIERSGQMHDIKQCPLQRRLKRILFLDMERQTGSFEDHLRKTYVDEMSFLAMIARFHEKVSVRM